MERKQIIKVTLKKAKEGDVKLKIQYSVYYFTERGMWTQQAKILQVDAINKTIYSSSQFG